LKRLLDEFSNTLIPSAAADVTALAVHAQSMHKLRGSAGLVGATTIHRLATQAEAACLAGNGESAAQLAARLASELALLRLSATPAFRRAADKAEKTTHADIGELEPQALSALVTLLRDQNLAAWDSFSAISPQLRCDLGKESFNRVRELMDKLQFSAAADALEESQR